jgi:hypothetical protein
MIVFFSTLKIDDVVPKFNFGHRERELREKDKKISVTL